MIRALIDVSIKNRFMVLIATLLISFAGWQAMKSTPLDAIPDLSDVQVIIFTGFPGQ
ncbi:MAG: efflux RND transporter permease subunit, partial [Sideroxydans sp.]